MRPDLRELAQEQERLRRLLVLNEPLPHDARVVAGCDVTFVPARGSRALALAAIAVVDLGPPGRAEADGPRLLQVAEAAEETTFPYVPGFLAYRELPVLLKAWRALGRPVDVFLLDAQGIAHPRGLGLASHFGVVTGERTVGCAKSWLHGAYKEPGAEPWSWTPLRDREGKIVGAAMRPGRGRRLLFVSPGHRVDLAGCLAIIRRASAGHRLPEPIRLAHLHLQRRRAGFGRMSGSVAAK